MATSVKEESDALAENLLANVIVTETEACGDPGQMVETLTALSALMDALDPETVLDVVGAKLFPRFSLFDLALRKAHRQELSRVGIADILLQETDAWLRELRILVDRCLIPTESENGTKSGSVRIDTPLSDAINVKRGLYEARRADEIRYLRYPIDANRLVLHQDNFDDFDESMWPVTGTLNWSDEEDEIDYGGHLNDEAKENATPSKTRRQSKRKTRRRPKEEPMSDDGIEIKDVLPKNRSSRRCVDKLEETLLTSVKTEQDFDDDQEGEYPCLKCGKILHKHYVKLHEQKCQGISVRHPKYKKVGDEYVCTVDGCNVGHSFSSVYGLRLHFHSSHVTEDERVFACPYCDERFSFRANRNKHVKQKHEKEFQCSQCGKRFGSKDKLLSHLRTHTGEKPFACDKCDYRAAKKFNLDVHKQTKHNEQSTGKYACEICHKLFQTPGRVRRHMDMIHNDNVKSIEKKKRTVAKKNLASQEIANIETQQTHQPQQQQPQQHFIIAEVDAPLFQKETHSRNPELATDSVSVDYFTTGLGPHEVISVPYQAL